MFERSAAGSARRAAIARARAAECALAEGALSTAIAALGAVALADPVGVDTFAVRLSLADALRRNGDARAAAAELRALLIARPEHEDAALAEESLRALGGTFDLTDEERLARAERLHDQHLHVEAIAELDRGTMPRDRALRARVLHLRGMALFSTRHDYAEAAVVLASAARLGGPTAAEDEFHAARALSRSDGDGRAIVSYRRFARRHGGTARALEAEYLAAWLELRRGRRAGENAMDRFVRSAAARGSSFARSGTFELGLVAYERGRFAAAARRFEAHAAMGPGALVRGRGLYWAGRAHERGRATSAALGRYHEAILVEPLHYYALLSRQRIEGLGEAPGDPFPSAEPRDALPPLTMATLPEDVSFYARLGLRGDAVSALGVHERAVREAQPDGRGLEGLVAAYHRLGEAARPYRLVVNEQRAELARRPDAFNDWIWRAAYPEAFRSQVVSAAEAQRLEPEYLWAIMRQESGYEPEAVSYADAIGLLQMLPATTARVAEGLGVPFSRELLFDPAWNARFAARYNAVLRERFGVPLAFAAYNGGGHRVEAWLEARGPMDFDLFVEQIGITQTKNYIRRVTSHYARYVYLRDPDGGWPIELPLRVGE
jgi:soluble lytic murein transglycosylase